MAIRQLVIFIITSLLLQFSLHTLEGAEFIKVNYHGYSGIVDLSDIDFPVHEEIKEETLRRISAHITRRYHEQGYRAFYIERVIVKPDGVL